MILIVVLRSNRTRNGLILNWGQRVYIGIKKKRQPILGVSFCTEGGRFFEHFFDFAQAINRIFLE